MMKIIIIYLYLYFEIKINFNFTCKASNSIGEILFIYELFIYQKLYI